MASIFFQFRSAFVSISIVRHTSLFFRSCSGDLRAMYLNKQLTSKLSKLIATHISSGYYCAPIFFTIQELDCIGSLFYLIAAVSISNGYYLGALCFCNSKNLNCIGALSFLKICSQSSNWSSHFDLTETGKRAKKRVVLRRGFLSL